jgi:hypothetical protein
VIGQRLVSLTNEISCYREESQETVTLLEENVKDLEKEKDILTSQLQGALEARKEQDKVQMILTS